MRAWYMTAGSQRSGLCPWHDVVPRELRMAWVSKGWVSRTQAGPCWMSGDGRAPTNPTKQEQSTERQRDE